MSETVKTCALAFAFLLLVGCSPRPPHWQDVCVDSYTTMQPITTMSCINGSCTPRIHMMPVTHCREWERQCVIDPSYTGPQADCSQEPSNG